ncbi:serine hydrolase domain-containing protein [Hydrogenophaga sp.]|uniref:serine hydrolase domain-containing protein n=1 Tax=Hydrogenophaga sp. TaxID=1904254 RepID=UPI002603EBC7|nr:serine hydrolase domain-containing protein [Hydrogenophaga sp.]MCW5654745.1 beta-lactamase family protein [Hydrogenophaga sp.]
MGLNETGWQNARRGRATIMALLAAATTLAHAAPDESFLGADAGYPRGTPQQVTEERYKVGSFSALAEILPSRPSLRGGPVWVLEEGKPLPPVSYNFRGTTLPLDAYFDRRRVTSLLVLHKGQIRLERYQYGRNADHRFASFSMAKSVTALLVGIALERGLIKSVDDKAEVYAPELAGSAYGDSTIAHLLQMASGVRWNEDYSGRDDVSDLWGALFRVHAGGNPTQVLTRRRPMDAEPGTRFKYGTGETQVLCHVLKGATKRNAADLTTEWLWQPLGAQADAAWLVGWQDIEYCGGGFNATTRDYARLGRLLALGGRRDGQQIVPEAFLQRATDHTRQPPGFRLNEPGPRFGYGWQYWLVQDGFLMQGVYGQMVAVFPAQDLVVVHTAVWPRSSDPDARAERDTMVRALVTTLAQE